MSSPTGVTAWLCLIEVEPTGSVQYGQPDGFEWEARRVLDVSFATFDEHLASDRCF